MVPTAAIARLRASRESLIREIKEAASTRLWHLDRLAWSRKGIITRCLTATLYDLLKLLGSYADDAESLPELDFRIQLAESEACWSDAGLTPTDTAALLDLFEKSVLRVLAAERAVESIWLVQAGLNALRANHMGNQLRLMTEEVARQRDDAMAAQHLAGRFLANASHEIRTPLTAVLGFSELLLEETYGDLNAEQRTAIGHIENSAQNLLEIVNNLLDLMQFRAGKLELQYRRVAMEPVLHNVFNILVPLSKRRKVRFRQELPDDLGYIEADEGIVRHIVYHLLESALRATPEDGEVVLRAERSEGCLTIVTYDTALHFPPEAVENMNDAYPILENSPARGYDGWEIGLPLVRRYVDLHSGSMTIESSLDRGTTIRVQLPTHRPSNPAAGRIAVQR